MVVGDVVGDLRRQQRNTQSAQHHQLGAGCWVLVLGVGAQCVQPEQAPSPSPNTNNKATSMLFRETPSVS